MASAAIGAALDLGIFPGVFCHFPVLGLEPAGLGDAQQRLARCLMALPSGVGIFFQECRYLIDVCGIQAGIAAKVLVQPCHDRAP